MDILTEEQVLIQKMVRQFSEEEIKPEAAEIDKNHRFPVEAAKRMAELGLFGLTIPEEYGGGGADTVSFVLAMEEMSKISAAHSTVFAAHLSLGLGAIMFAGNEAQKKKYVPDLAAGKKLCAFALTEPGAGSDSGAQKTTAVKQGDKYILNGTKCFITNGGYADLIIVVAVTNKNKGMRGLSAFLVEKTFPGFYVGQIEDKMGIRGSSTAEIILKDCEVPAENLLGREGMGFIIAMRTLDSGRIIVGAQGVGVAKGALEAAIAYSKERVQFGKPICRNQGLQWMLADMATHTECAHQLVMNAARLKDAGLSYAKEAAMAKLYAGETAMDVATKAIQIHGGVGYTTAFPVERIFRDAKVLEIYEGTSEIQRMVIASHILA